MSTQTRRAWLLERVIGRERPRLLVRDPLRRVDDAIWVLDGVHLMRIGLHEPIRMTVLRLADGSVVLHSPLPVDAETRAALDSIGVVRWIVAPNLYHHLYASDALRAWPEARLFSVRGLSTKRPELPIAGELPEAAPREWTRELESLDVGPFRGFREVLLFHRPSRTLVLTDLAFHIDDAPSSIERWIWRFNGVYRQLGPTLLLRIGALRGAGKGAGNLSRVLEWDFDRIIVAHGAILETGGRAAFQRAFGIGRAEQRSTR